MSMEGLPVLTLRATATPGEAKPAGNPSKKDPQKGPQPNQGGMPRLAPEKTQKVDRPRDRGPPRRQEVEGDKYIIQFHPVEQTDNSDRQKARAKRQGSEGEPENARAT